MKDLSQCLAHVLLSLSVLLLNGDTFLNNLRAKVMWTIQSRTNSKTVRGGQMPGLGETVGLPLKRNTPIPVFTLEEREELCALHWV